MKPKQNRSDLQRGGRSRCSGGGGEDGRRAARAGIDTVVSALRRPSAQTKRLVCAVTVVAFLVFSPVIANGVIGLLRYGHDAAEAKAGIAPFPRLDTSDPFASLDKLEAQLEATNGSVPDSYLDEIGLLPGAFDVRESEGGVVVSYLVEGSAQEALGQVEAEMEGRGWSGVSLGGIEGETFVKSEGVYRWMLVTATQVGDTVSVVERMAGS